MLLILTYSSHAHLPKCTLFAPQNFAEALFLISVGTAVIPRRNENQKIMQNFGGQTRCIMGDVQVANCFLFLIENVLVAVTVVVVV